VLPAAGAPKAPGRGEAVAVNVEKGPACDGTMADPAWQQCPPWPMGACTSRDPQKYKTFARVLFDGRFIYVGVYCQEPDTDGLAIGGSKHDDPTWNGDSVEVFLRPDPQQPYYQFVANPRGVLYDARDKQPSWNSAAEVKAAIDKGKAWTVTFKIPLKELPTWVGEDQAWTMNVYRTRPARGGDPTLQYSWSVMNGEDYHAPLEFGMVTGIDIPRREDGVTRVREGGAPRPAVVNRGTEVGGVTVYRKMTFNKDTGDWKGDNRARATLTNDAVAGNALHVVCGGGWSGAELPIRIVGSRGLKLAVLMRGRKLESVGVNIHDSISGDNTTSYGYRYLDEGRFTPILYYLDRCRYNSETTGYVSPNTAYDALRFYCPQQFQPGMEFTIDNLVIYRGTDKQAPEKVTGLKAQATSAGVKLSWQAAEDNVAPQMYVISRAEGGGPFEKIAESNTTSHLDRTAGRGDYRYRVLAVDFEENLGPWSDAVSVRSISTGKEPQLAREQKDRPVYDEHVRRIHAKGAGKVRKGHATLFGDSLTGATVYPQCAQSAFGTLTVNAFGYASMRTDFGRNKVGEILDRDNPEFMFILYGTNNNKAAERIPAAMDDLAAIVKACEANGTVPILGTIPPRGWTPESAPEANFNRHVVELCRKLEVPCGYIFEDFQAAGDRRRHLSGDGVHWTGSGMAIAGRAWGKTLDQIRFTLRDRR